MLAQLKTVTEAPAFNAARKAVGEAAEALGRRTPKAAVLLDNCAEEILAVYELPERHRKRMRSTKHAGASEPGDHAGRTRVIRIFPNEQACLRLVSTL